MGAMDGLLSRAWPAPRGDDHLVGAPDGCDGRAVAGMARSYGR